MRRTSIRNALLALAALIAIGLGVATVLQIAHEARPRTDFTVYMTGAQAVLRGGGELYTATEVHGWHYTMPPLCAICAVPLTLLPLPLASGLWYVASIALLVWSVRRAARLVTPADESPSIGVVLVPLVLCADPLLNTLARGQMGIAMLAACVGALHAERKGRPFVAGLLVAFASVLKVYSGLLVLYFLCRRDWRALRGCLAGFVLFGVLIPAAVFGPRLAGSLWWQWFTGVVLPYGRPFGEALPFMELQNHMIAKNQSLYATLAHLADMLHAEPLGAGQTWIKVLAALVCVGLLVLLWTTWRSLPRQLSQAGSSLAWSLALMFGLLLVPTSWSHYFVLLLLPLAAAWAHVQSDAPESSRALLRRALIAFTALSAAYTLTSIVRPAAEQHSYWLKIVMLPRSAGLLCIATLVLGVAFARVLRRDAAAPASAV